MLDKAGMERTSALWHATCSKGVFQSAVWRSFHTGSVNFINTIPTIQIAKYLQHIVDQIVWQSRYGKNVSRLIQHPLGLANTLLANDTNFILFYNKLIQKSKFPVSPVVYKVLASDYSNYLLVCGYSNVNQAAGAFVFSRDVKANYTSYSGNYATYSDFNNLETVYQGKKCNGANSSLPMAGLLLAIVYAILKYVN